MTVPKPVQAGALAMEERHVLDGGWQLLSSAPGAHASPEDLPEHEGWLDAPARGPVAEVLRALGRWSLDAAPVRFDAQDWWYRLRFDLPEGLEPTSTELGFDGLATVAEVWLNGQPLLSSTNMFLAHRCAVGPILRPLGNVLVIACRSLDQALTQRRPRPRWRAPMIEHQQLRWFRTTLLGRTPGWSPPAAVVGPWRPVWLASRPPLRVDDLCVSATVEGTDGRLSLSCRPVGDAAQAVSSARLQLTRGGQTWTQDLAASLTSPGGWAASVTVPQVAAWWPHTHGEPARYGLSLHLRLGAQVDAQEQVVDLGEVGFRTVHIDRRGEGFALQVNGVQVFCRGACWTPLDVVTLDAGAPAYEAALQQVREAGMNMVRVGGTMSYEADAFYDACDRLGIMVWQELMFANMDYPEDEAFVAGVRQEVAQQLRRWQGRPAMVVLCGNSEVEQQAAMFGATRERWTPALFHEVLADQCRAARPDVPYWPSSAHGGAFPHQGDAGTTSYYGVGAYLRPLEDARRAQVAFATECLAFANTPEPACLARMPGGLGLRAHHAAWKARAPRDLGAGWDFEDVRDHYVAQLFGLDPARLRYSDHERYLALGRVAVGEVMSATFAEWRRQASPCGGALVWFLRDLWPGAGWGVVDALGHPKAPFYFLKRALQPVSVSMTDEGGNGMYVHVVNDRPEPLRAELVFSAWRHGDTRVGEGRQHIEVPAHGSASWPVLAWFDWFADWSWSYRFGPPGAQVLTAALLDAQGQALGRAFAFPTGHALPVERDLGLRAVARVLPEGGYELAVRSERFAQAVQVDVEGFVSEDAYFHLAAGEQRALRLRALPGSAVAAAAGRPLTGEVRALNLEGGVAIQWESEST